MKLGAYASGCDLPQASPGRGCRGGYKSYVGHEALRYQRSLEVKCSLGGGELEGL